MVARGEPIGVFGLEVAPELPSYANDVPGPIDISITMAAIDPTEEVEDDGPKRATLILMRVAPDVSDDDEDDDEDDEDDEDSDDVRAIEERLKLAIPGFLDEYQEESGDSDEDSETDHGATGSQQTEARDKLFGALRALQGNAVSDAVQKGISKAVKKAAEAEADAESEGEDEEGASDEDDDDSYEEFVICTLDEKTCQQPINISISHQERVFFRVKGNLSVHLTGNYYFSQNAQGLEGEDSDEDDYDSEDDEDDEDPLGLLAGMEVDEDDDSEDELDELDEEPRIVELKEASGNKKRSAEAEDKKAKKQKSNAGTAVAEAEPVVEKAEEKKESKKDKKAKKAAEKEKKAAEEAAAAATAAAAAAAAAAAKKDEEKEEKDEEKKKPAARKVNGVLIEDKKVGSGPVAKEGNKVDMRYIGKLKNGKRFDANTKGKPFTFRLGKGEVIKGWDVGVAGMSPGGERKLTVPAHMAYGNQALPGIPANSTLVFEVKLLNIH